jgi:quercetin dioxygenase-like cupin family protein
MRSAAVLALFAALVASGARADQSVEVKGFHAKVMATLGDFGHLQQELGGKYQLRVTETTIDPEGSMGAHNHLGPGVRCLLSGELTYMILGQTSVYHAGDCFTETGAISHEAHNHGTAPVKLYNFEILPAELPAGKGSLIPAR